MNKTEMNLAIAGIKGLINPEQQYVARVELRPAANPGTVPDYLSPELNRELELELLNAGWSPLKDDEFYNWHNKISCLANMQDYKLIGDEDFSTATALAWIEAFK